MNIRVVKYIICTVIFCTVSTSKAVTSASWYDTSGSALYGSDDATDVSMTADWRFQLVVDVTGDTQFGLLAAASSWDGYSGFNTSDDIVVDGKNWGLVFGTPTISSTASVADGYAGKIVYVRFFDSNTAGFGAGGNVGIIYDDGTDAGGNQWVLPPVASPAVNINLNPGALAYVQGTGTNIDGWSTTIAAVPEPGTIALFLMGLMTFGARGLKRRK